MNTQNVQNELNKTNALIQQLEPIIETIRKQEQEIINHRVSLGAQLAALKERSATYERMLKEEDEQ